MGSSAYRLTLPPAPCHLSTTGLEGAPQRVAVGLLLSCLSYGSPGPGAYKRVLLVWEILVGAAAGPQGIQEYLSGPVLEAGLEV